MPSMMLLERGGSLGCSLVVVTAALGTVRRDPKCLTWGSGSPVVVAFRKDNLM